MYSGYSSDLADLYGSYGRSSSSLGGVYATANNAYSWALPALIISIIVAILVYFLFLSKKNEGKFKGFAGWLYEFLDFKKLAVEGILKILYMGSALYLTIMSFTIISANFGTFLIALIGGNVLLRIVYELMLVLLIVCKNTSEINKKMSNKNNDDVK